MCKMMFSVFILVSIATSPVITWVTRSGAACGKSQKQCADGSCITLESKCENVLLHHNSSYDLPLPHGPPLGTRNRRYANPLISSRQCVLPPYPEHGTYVVSNVPDASPGQHFDSLVLTVSCRRGFGFQDSIGGIDSHGTQEIYCLIGKWYQRMPKCIRYCKLDPHPSVRYTCHAPGDDFRPCRRYLPPGTAVNPLCNDPIYTSSKVLPYMKCGISGYWDYIAVCQAECGQVTSEGIQLVLGGEIAKRGELPWHVGVYRKTTDPYMQICGGSLVSKNVVISAAHCFWDDIRKQLPASEFAVATGKLYRPWNDPHDVDVQRSDLKEIKIPVLFYGSATNLQEDIATMILKKPITYMSYIRPVCLHFDLNFERRQLQQGKYGKVAGWGLTEADGHPSPLLKVVQLPFISAEICLRTAPKQFREYLTVDKFCAGYTNGTALCRGDSGGGLSFAARTELDIERYYLRGVVSAAPTTDTICNPYTFTAFTKITKHEEFIKDALARADKTCPPYSFQCDDGECVYQGADCNGNKDCADGSDETEELCTPGYESTTPPQSSSTTCIAPSVPEHGSYKVSNSPNAKPGQSFDSFTLTVSCDQGYDMVDPSGADKRSPQQIKCSHGEWEQAMPKCAKACGRVSPEEIGGNRRELPWHVGVYMKVPNYLQICGGTLVSHRVVLTAATCFDEDKRIYPNKYSVAAGKLHGRWNDRNDGSTQKSDVKEVKISSLSKSSKSKIAALVLVSSITYTPSVRPACINLDPSFEAKIQEGGKLGKTATWPFEAGQAQPYKLQQLEPVELSNYLETCNSFLRAAQEEKLCAAYTKDPRIFAVFAGSGLVYPRKESGLQYYYLRGVMSNLLICGNGCVDSDYNYHAFTKLSDYKDFVEKSIA